MDDYLMLVEENAVLDHELNTLLDLIFDGVETESYINPFGIMAYLKAVYPNRWEKKLNRIYAQGN